jgi:tRNA/tmRNA/rRNA uracil-C5-methylase (TrmA/RlmC/RlmD family)
MKSFKEYFHTAIQANRPAALKLEDGDCRSDDGQQCSLCHACAMSYDDEARSRQSALNDFNKEYFSALHFEPLVLSPLGRLYRTVTKRKAFHTRNGVRLGLIDPDAERGFVAVRRCLIEPDAHQTIFRLVQEKIAKPYASRLAEALQHVIIKGNYHEQTLILSVSEFTPAVFKAANTLSKSLTHEVPSIIGLFLYLDRPGSGYYLGSNKKSSGVTLHKVFGKPEIFVKVGDVPFLFHPLGFSQINLSMTETLVGAVRSLLPSEQCGTLYDLYCGYGLFSLSLAPRFQSVLGMELSHQAIESAKANALRRRADTVRFLCADVTAESVVRQVRRCSKQDVVLLDPPRNGTNEGVIDAIASCAPGLVIHIFCNIDLLPKDLKTWEANGYAVEHIIPMDNFPGTNDVEVVAALRKVK